MKAIIEHGKIKVRRFKCQNCDCIFDADKTDYTVEHQRDDICYMSKCPECDNNVYDFESRYEQTR